ncbi:ATP-binding protein [Nocardia abscessus]|uniref:ATP-binding protein n=1 Tax=Nocardia abscessus TaxID=120957 RepID=UPI0018938F6C|nr:ATP-binding protein [Nocardia abscessus]MBF6337097.1 ATP-binding protein [Nocardia abscessus]
MSAASLRYLLARLAVIEARVRRAVAQRRADDPQPDDPFRGLYLSDDTVDRLLNSARAPLVPDPLESRRAADAEVIAAAARSEGEHVRLARVIEEFGLDGLDAEVLLVALAPDVDSRFEWLYGYLNDDVTRRRATVGLALSLCGVPAAAAAGRARFSAESALVGSGLVTIAESDRPLLARTLRIPDRVVGYLLGDDAPDPELCLAIAPAPPEPAQPDPGLVAALSGRHMLVYLRERPGGGGTAVAAAAARRIGREVLIVDLPLVADQPSTIATAVLEARLRGAVLVAAGVDGFAERPETIRALADAQATVVLVGSAVWDPAWARRQPVPLDVAPPSAADRSRMWRAVLADPLSDGSDAAEATMQFVLTPEQLARAATAATVRAELAGRPMSAEDLRFGARAQNSAGLERLARRIEPAVGWPDLVLPQPVLSQLREVALRARQRTVVLDEWRMRPGGGRGRGVTALFTGDSGTGKTMSAEVIAADLGLDLYTVNLATVVDKYIGETEKNLERIFVAAAGVNAVLLFDEADALFGRRTEVRDSHDRYANIESAYLLQRMESFDGLAILATNLRANLDDAFTRRLDVVVNYPTPDEDARRSLWERCVGTRIPRSADLDLHFCARSFELSGGNIRSAVITAAYLAAGAGRELCTADLVAGVHREYRKLGRLTLAREFGPYHESVRQ